MPGPFQIQLPTQALKKQLIPVQVDRRCTDIVVIQSIYLEGLQYLSGQLITMLSLLPCLLKNLASTHNGHGGTPGRYAENTLRRWNALLACHGGPPPSCPHKLFRRKAEYCRSLCQRTGQRIFSGFFRALFF